MPQDTKVAEPKLRTLKFIRGAQLHAHGWVPAQGVVQVSEDEAQHIFKNCPDLAIDYSEEAQAADAAAKAAEEAEAKADAKRVAEEQKVADAIRHPAFVQPAVTVETQVPPAPEPPPKANTQFGKRN